MGRSLGRSVRDAGAEQLAFIVIIKIRFTVVVYICHSYRVTQIHIMQNLDLPRTVALHVKHGIFIL